LLAAQAHLESGDAGAALRLLRLHSKQLPQPAGDWLLASCAEAANDPASAAVYYQQVYYQHPSAPEAEQAASALVRLKSVLGGAYPPPRPQAMLERAEKWQRAGNHRRARAEYESITSQAAGAERDQARVRIGVSDYLASQTTAAYSYLKALEVASPEAEAERLFYLAECARRLERDKERLEIVARLGELDPQSPWRLKAVVSAANRYLVENQPEVYEPLYGACFESFPSDPQAEYCHWKVVWSAYVRRRPEAAAGLREHLKNYPGSEKSSTALYFLGRLAEAGQDQSAAKAYYAQALERFPNHHYAVLAKERLAQPEFARVLASSEVTEFLSSVQWPPHRYPDNFEPTPATRLRIERSRLLAAAALDELAEKELRFGAETDGQPHLLGMELAQAAARQGAPSKGIRVLKSLVPGYLSMPLEGAPDAFWRLLFPLPYRSELERNARQNGLDPFLVAGLVRQESEFNPQAVSAAHAYGLTQILPGTGRALARKLGPRRFRTSMLLRPEINLRLGTSYLRRMWDENARQWEATLAAFNAGQSRVANWLSWRGYQEPAEFVESIPFSETRNYVLAVLRNTQIYRRLYGAEKRVAADGPQARKAPAKKATSPKKKKRSS
jgi:soluble lytic murein transglycosylase